MILENNIAFYRTRTLFFPMTYVQYATTRTFYWKGTYGRTLLKKRSACFEQ